jgi:hypothetical protein
MVAMCMGYLNCESNCAATIHADFFSGLTQTCHCFLAHGNKWPARLRNIRADEGATTSPAATGKSRDGANLQILGAAIAEITSLLSLNCFARLSNCAPLVPLM